MNSLFDTLKPYADVVGRVLIATLFLLSGWGKIAAYAGTQAYMQHAGVPGGLLPLVILLELGGGLAIVIGLYTRPVALLMAGFSIVVGLLFHPAPPHPVQHILFLKNLGLAGGV